MNESTANCDILTPRRLSRVISCSAPFHDFMHERSDTRLVVTPLVPEESSKVGVLSVTPRVPLAVITGIVCVHEKLLVGRRRLSDTPNLK